jgi:hypothetical protein
MEYVRLSKPQHIVTDNYRVGYAETLARQIRKRFGISVTPLPKK